MSKAKQPASSNRETGSDLFTEEDRLLAEAEQMTVQLAEMSKGLQQLTTAYRRAIKEQKRMVRVSDRLQSELRDTKVRLEGEVKAREKLAEEFRLLAATDSLTGAASRRHFLDLARAEIDRRASGLTPLAIVIADIDRFKSLNDTYGHAAGDVALSAFVSACRASSRPTDVVGRLGGEEFALLAPDTDLGGGVEIAETLREAVERIVVEHEGIEIRMTASFGVAALGAGGLPSCRIDPVSNLLAGADAALYAAKKNGRNRVEQESLDGKDLSAAE